MGEKPKHLKFKYVYPEDLRDLHVNGIFGGVTPRHEIYAHFFSERHPIPKSSTYELTDEGHLGAEISTEKGGDVVRFIQASIVTDVATAVAIRDWLTGQIEIIHSKIEKEKGRINGKDK
jgi:hypothetical protein